MCFEDTCLPLCARMGHFDEPYCIEKRRLENLKTPAFLAKKQSLCAAGDEYVADGVGGLLCRFVALLGLPCKSGLQQAAECKDYLKASTGRDHFIDTRSVIGGGGMSHYYKVVAGKR